jgi:hypothetical protein
MAPQNGDRIQIKEDYKGRVISKAEQRRQRETGGDSVADHLLKGSKKVKRDPF